MPKTDTYSWKQAWLNMVPPIIVSASITVAGLIVGAITAAALGTGAIFGSRNQDPEDMGTK